jgi:hypothetical protein
MYQFHFPDFQDCERDRTETDHDETIQTAGYKGLALTSARAKESRLTSGITTYNSTIKKICLSNLGTSLQMRPATADYRIYFFFPDYRASRGLTTRIYFSDKSSHGLTVEADKIDG